MIATGYLAHLRERNRSETHLQATAQTAKTSLRSLCSSPVVQKDSYFSSQGEPDDPPNPSCDLLALIDHVAAIRGWSEADKTETVKDWRTCPEGIEAGLRHLLAFYGERPDAGQRGARQYLHPVGSPDPSGREDENALRHGSRFAIENHFSLPRRL